jgi:hypothetical protein
VRESSDWGGGDGEDAEDEEDGDADVQGEVDADGETLGTVRVSLSVETGTTSEAVVPG